MREIATLIPLPRAERAFEQQEKIWTNAFRAKLGALKRADRLRLSELASSRTRYRNFEKDRDRNLLP